MKYLTYEERKKIEKMLRYDRASYRSIGKVLERSHATIIYEVQNNQGHNPYYSAENAHERFLRRQNNKGNKGKIETNEKLLNYIVNKLQDDWSPEHISGRLKRFHQQTIGYVCMETIYQYIYAEKQKKEKLFFLLRRHKPKRINWHIRRKNKIKIPDRTSIHQRLEEINTKVRFGDWETDSMIFSKQKDILSVQVERKSKLLRMHKCKNKTAEETKEAIYKTIDSLPLYCFKSITYDNGTENVKHTEIKKNFEIETYFCDPYCSWQKGLVEHTNMLIRQYLPRWKNLHEISEEEIYAYQEKINNRPRKSLNFLTPNEYANLFINKQI